MPLVPHVGVLELVPIAGGLVLLAISGGVLFVKAVRHGNEMLNARQADVPIVEARQIVDLIGVHHGAKGV